MKKLTEFNKWHMFLLIFLTLLSIAFFIFIFNYKIDKVKHVEISIDEKRNIKLLGDSSLSYLLDKDQKIVLEINNKNYEVKLKKIITNIKGTELIIYNFPKNVRIYPNSIINSYIFLDQKPLFMELFGK
ncbi:MAG1140 family protein [Mycoplasmopsis meleagridis]|uniref:MAG1140 family protein n=1 Tax=Mycoplasmopsis meleagridis TaxID=29561 RepID=UPI00069830DF|nr:hypothetical protein [Mycoplasmopsis meleagridis]